MAQFALIGGLAVGQVQSNQVFVIDPAPRSFGLPGF